LVETLKELSVNVLLAPRLSEHLDGVFVAHTAVILPDVTIVARPEAASRLNEIDSIAQIIGQYRPLQSIVAPATLDGDDVLRIGRTLYVAETHRTNAEGIDQLREIVRPFGYDVTSISTHDGLRLKSACTFIPPQYLLANPERIDTSLFKNLVVIPVAEQEPFAASALTIARTAVVSASCQQTEKRLRNAGVVTRSVDLSEFEKAGGGISSLALVLEPRAPRNATTDASPVAVHASGVPLPNGHFSHAIVCNGFVYVSPLPPYDSLCSRSPRLSAKDQVEHAIQNLSAVLGSTGSSLDRVVRLTLHVADPKLLKQIEEPYARMFGSHRPARSVIANPALPSGILVEVEAVAAVSNNAN
jgi:dimethylargininase